MLASAATITVATKVNHWVQTACPESALRPSETPSIPDAAQMKYASKNKTLTTSRNTGPPTAEPCPRLSDSVDGSSENCLK